MSVSGGYNGLGRALVHPLSINYYFLLCFQKTVLTSLLFIPIKYESSISHSCVAYSQIPLWSR